MAADFTQDAVLVFLQSCGGSVKNTELLTHFQPFLREHPDQLQNRDLFKKFVNSLATVTKIDGVSTVVLRKKFRGHVSAGGSGRDSAEPGPVGGSSSPAGDTERKPVLPATGIRVESRSSPSPEPAGRPAQVGHQVPGLSVPAPGGPAGRHQDYVPEPTGWQEIPEEDLVQDGFPGQVSEPRGHIVLRQDFPHTPSRRLDTPHQGVSHEPVRGHIVRRRDHAPEPDERWDPPNQGTVSEPNKGHIVRRQDHAPDLLIGQKTSHQDPIVEPFRGHVVSRQNRLPGPVGGQQTLHQSPFPGPSRRREAPHLDPRGRMTSRVPEPIGGQNIYYQDPSRGPPRGWEVSAHNPLPQPLRGQQISYQVPQHPEPLRGQRIPYENPVPETFRGQNIFYQDPVPEYLGGHQIPQNLEPPRGQQVHQNLEPPRGHQIPQNLEPPRGQQVPQNLEPPRGQQIPYESVPEPIRGQKIYFLDSNPTLHRGQKIPFQDPIPEYLSGQQVHQNLEPPRGHQIPQNLEPPRGQQVPQNLEPPRGQQVHQNLEPLRGQQVHQNLGPLSGQQVHQNLEPVKGQQVHQNLEPVKGQQVHQSTEPLRGQQVHQNLEPVKGQQVHQSPEPLRGQQVHQNLEPVKGQQVHQSSEPLRGQQVHQSSEPLRGQRVHQNLEPVKGQQVHQSPEPFKGQQVHQSSEPLRGQRVHQNLQPVKGQQVHQSPEPFKGQQVHQSPEPLRGQQVHQNLQPVKGQQVHQSPEPLRGQQVHQNLEPRPQDAPPQLHQVPIRHLRYRKSYKSAVSQDEEEEEEEEVQIRRGSAGGQWPLNGPLRDVGRAVSASSPCITESAAPPSSSSGRKVPQICIHDSEPGPVPVESMRRSLPLEAERLPDQNQRSSPPDVRFSIGGWPPPGSSRAPGWDSSSRPDEPPSQEVLQESKRTKLEPAARRSNLKTPLHQSMGNLCDDLPPSGRLSPLYRSSDNLHDDHFHDDQQFASRETLLHQSTGDLYDDVQSSNGSLYSPRVQLRSSAARRMSSRLRNRMCRSVGTDLDQFLQDGPGRGTEDARLERLHRISSSLSLPHNLSSSSLSSCATPPRCPSPVAQAEGRKEVRRGLHSHNAGQSAVPLEAKEHAWMVKAAAGTWPDIYTLFREDNSLLNKQDFISGFTVLHWIAKHGDHRVLNTLWYGVEQKGLSFDVNAKSTGGQTPLHIAAIQGHKTIIRLLAKKFGANVKLRDMAGKKPWQYLSDKSPEILQMLGAPPQAALTQEAENAEPGWKPPKQRRHLRHHFSSASSGQRPLTVTKLIKVSRSSSIAALLKHKSLHRF